MQAGIGNYSSPWILRICRQISCKISSVCVRKRNLLIQSLSLNQAAPFHIVEEESLMFFGPEIHRSASVEAVGMEAQLGHFLRRMVEAFARMEGVVASEFPP